MMPVRELPAPGDSELRLALAQAMVGPELGVSGDEAERLVRVCAREASRAAIPFERFVRHVKRVLDQVRGRADLEGDGRTTTARRSRRSALIEAAIEAYLDSAPSRLDARATRPD